MKKLNITADGALPLPLDAVTQTFAILAVKGSGKSYTASVIAEEMLKLNQQIVVIDMTGAWYGLKSSADGKSDGFQIAIFGGDHADIPLQEHAGELIAQVIVERQVSAILDLSLFRKAQVFRFLAAFLETLYRLNRQPLHLFADEADAYVPQKVFGEQARTVGAMEDIVRRGRKKGIGCSMITQRPASINKDVLTQCEVLIALRMVHPRDIDAIKEWIEVHSTLLQARDMISKLPSLPTGTAYLWSPSWLQVFDQIKIRKRDTFDSGATPKPGEQVRVPKKLASIDIKQLGQEIEQTVERAKADDPIVLKRRIAELILEIEGLKKRKVTEVPLITDQQVDKIERTVNRILTECAKHHRLMDDSWGTVKSMLEPLHLHIDKLKERDRRPIEPTGLRKYPVSDRESFIDHGAYELSAHNKAQNSPFGKAERLILTALVQYRRTGRTKTQIALLSGYSQNGGAFNNALGKCRTSGWAVGGGDRIEITDEGVKALGDWKPLPTGRALLGHWYGQLGKAERSILQVVSDAYPKALSKAEVGHQTGYEPAGGAFNNALGKLRTLELIERGIEIRASKDLFD